MSEFQVGDRVKAHVIADYGRAPGSIEGDVVEITSGGLLRVETATDILKVNPFWCETIERPKKTVKKRVRVSLATVDEQGNWLNEEPVKGWIEIEVTE